QRLVQQKETDFHGQIYDLKQKVTVLNETLERQRKDSGAVTREMQERIDELTGTLEQERNQYQAQRSALEATAEERGKRIEKLNSGILELESQLDQQNDSIESLNRQVERLKTESAELQNTINSNQQQFERDRNRLMGEYNARIEELNAEITRRQQSLDDRNTRIESQAARIESLQVEVAQLRDQKTDLVTRLEQEQSLQSRLDEEIQSLKKQIEDMSGELKSRSTEIDSLKNNLSDSAERENKLRRDLGMHRDRETRLEQAIAGFKEELHGVQNKLNAAQQKGRTLEQKNNELLANIETLRANLNDQYAKEKKLQGELKAAIAREKGSREEGHLLSEIANKISNLSEFHAKLEFIRASIPGEGSVDRMMVYSLHGEDRLRYEVGYHQDRPVTALSGRMVALSETVYGQALASLRPQELQRSRQMEDIDLPGELLSEFRKKIEGPDQKSDRMKSFLLLPLAESEKVIGLLVLASRAETGFSELRIRLLATIAPLIALALKYELNFAELRLYRNRINNIKQVIRYQQSRYVRIADHFNRLSTRVLDRLRQSNGQEGDELVQEVRSHADAPVPRLGSQGEGYMSLIEWIDSLGSRASSAIGLDFQQDVDPELVRELSERIGVSFQNLFWIIAEAIDNVILHSQAQKLHIQIQKTDDQHIHLSIIDNGEGLIRTSGSADPTRGSGLKAIRHLTEESGGVLELDRDEKGHGLA
ncbi:MAG: hypothetical protein KDK34_18370, partial [Leptospiraceae bacterium]|nr:hypothetical protein [Leptospiraceae bacterium]